MIRSRKIFRPKVFLTSSVVVLLVVIGFVAYQHYRYIPGRVTFQEYAPSYLPKGVSIKSKELQAWYVPAGEPTKYTGLSIELSDGVAITETNRYKKRAYGCLYVNVKGSTCMMLFTHKGQPYYKITSYSDSSKDLLVEAHKGSTVITLRASQDRFDTYSANTARIIDSLEPVEYKELPLRQIDKSVI